MNYFVASIALGFFYILAAGAGATMQRGLKWNAGARDGEVPPLKGMAARLDRASKNFLETFPFYLAAVIAVILGGKGLTEIGSGLELYFWARVVYIPLYAFGVPYLRTVTWGASIVGIIMILAAAF